MKAKGVFWAVAGFLRRQLFGIAIIACAAVAFAFPKIGGDCPQMKGGNCRCLILRQ